MKSLFALFIFFSGHAFALEPQEISRVQSLLNLQKAATNGPNCWNAALYGRGLVEGIRHVDGYEFTAWLSSPLCHEVSANDIQSGDIAALRRAKKDGTLVKGPYGSEIHGFFVASPEIGFTKNGTNVADIYQMQDQASIIQAYETTNKKECRMMGLPNELCQLKAQYFRCDPKALVWHSELTEITRELSEIESHLHQFYTGSATGTDRNSFKAEIKSKAQDLQQQLSDLGTSQAPDWQIELLEARLASAAVLLF